MTIGTVVESSHIPLHVWLQGMHLICTSKKGFSANQLHRTLGITLKSAWLLGHRIREAIKDLSWPDAGSTGGEGMTIEADETYVGGKAHNRAFGPIPPKSPVVALVERGGRVRSFHVRMWPRAISIQSLFATLTGTAGSWPMIPTSMATSVGPIPSI